jgi:hypothetical protein
MFTEEHAALLPEDIRSDPGLQSFNDFGGLAKSYLETKSMVGRSIQLPAKDGKPEDLAKWQTETGAKLKDLGLTIAKPNEPPPETPDKYDFKVEGFAPEVIKDDIVVNLFREFAHENKIPNGTANKLVEFWAKKGAPALLAKLNEAQAANQVEMIEQPEERDKVWAEAFKGLEPSKISAERDETVAMTKAEIPELEDFMTGTAPSGGPWMTNGDHPAMIKILQFIRQQKQPDFGGHVNGSNVSMDSAAASEAEDIRSNPANAKHKLYMSGDQHTLDYVDNLWKKAYGDKEVVANEFLPKIIDRTGTNGR